MMRRGLWLWAVLSATSAGAWEVRLDGEGDVVRWTHPVQLHVERHLGAALNEPRAADALRAALAEVGSATPGLELALREGDELAVGYDVKAPQQNQNVVVALAEWPWAPGNLAATIVTLNRRTNEIIDADIAFNLEEFAFRVLDGDGRAAANANDVQNTLTHELGHALGLMHNEDDPRVVMFPASPAGEIQKRRLASDDREGLGSLYPAPPTAPEPSPAAGCSTTGGAPGLLLSSLMVVLSLWRRRALAAALAAPVAASASEAPRAATVTTPERALVGQVTSTRSRWALAGLIVTDVEVKVLACEAPCEKTVVVTMVGGRVGDLEQVVTHSPVPASGDTVLVKSRGARSHLSIVRWLRTQERVRGSTP